MAVRMEVMCANKATVLRLNQWLAKTSESSRTGDREHVICILGTKLTPSDVLVAVGSNGILGITPLETGPARASS